MVAEVLENILVYLADNIGAGAILIMGGTALMVLCLHVLLNYYFHEVIGLVSRTYYGISEFFGRVYEWLFPSSIRSIRKKRQQLRKDIRDLKWKAKETQLDWALDAVEKMTCIIDEEFENTIQREKMIAAAATQRDQRILKTELGNSSAQFDENLNKLLRIKEQDNPQSKPTKTS